MINTATLQTTPIKVYFKNLNAIRFIAALLVFIHHAEQFKDLFHIPNYWKNVVRIEVGQLGLVLFFVLSGFLISYLLFKEEFVTKTINIKDFYIRRILRIWPLYFLIFFMAFLILPFISFFTLEGFERNVIWNNLATKVALFVLFLPNLVLNLFGVIPYASQTWSIGSEEQFYLIWPFLNRRIKNKWVLMVGVIFIYRFIESALTLLHPTKFLDVFTDFWISISISCMAIGGLFALIIHEKTSYTLIIQKVIFNKWFQWFALFLTVFLVYKGFYLPYFRYEFYSILFGILICNFAHNPQRIFSMEYPWISYLGKISYGLYMFHPIAIVLSIKVLQMYGLFSNIAFYPLALLTTILISTLSYEFFEKKFIDKKIKYSKLISGDNANEHSLSPSGLVNQGN